MDLRDRGSDLTVISSIGEPINRKNHLIREEFDEATIGFHPVQQLLAPNQPDFPHPVGQQIPLTFRRKRRQKTLILH